MLSSTIVLKDASDVSHNFVQIDTSANGGGIVRVDSGLTRPDRAEFKIRHQPTGKGLSAGQRHTLTLTRSVKDDVGNVRDMSINISLVVPDHDTFTNTLVCDQLHQAFDSCVQTGPFAIDTSFIASILLGES